MSAARHMIALLKSHLEVDDKELINLDGLHTASADSRTIHLNEGAHSIHVPYFQGAPNSVALELWVKPPGAQQWSIFDLQAYPTPPG